MKEFGQEITASSPALLLKQNETVTLPVSVKNVSSEKWYRSGKNYHVTVSYDWIDSAGVSSNRVDARLPEDVGPGQSVSVPIPVTAPSAAGKYTLHITLVQQNVAFFDRKGAKPLDLPVTVE